MNHHSYTDMMGRQTELPASPKRIISLVPSQTELLFDLGLSERIAGVTRFCVHPMPELRKYPRVGGTKDYDINLIRSIGPDLIIGNKEENEREGIEQLAAEFPVWMSDVRDLDSALEMIRSIGAICGKAERAEAMAAEISRGFAGLRAAVSDLPVLYLIWRKPWMAAGSDTFIDHMLGLCGCSNVCTGEGRYPELTDAEIAASGARMLLLSSEPYPFKERHIASLQQLLPEADIRLVDGELFSWYGSRLRLAVPYLSELFITESGSRA